MKRFVLTLLVISMVILGGCVAPPVPPSPVQMEPSVQPPHSPSNLIGEPVSQSVVNLEWSDNSDNEDGFRIYRNGDNIATIRANSITYQDTGLEGGKAYQYVVSAYNVAGESGACSCTVRTLNPPLNVTINHIGVIFDHDPIGPGDIGIVLVASDGYELIETIIPPGEETFQLNDYETIELNQRVFHTSSAGDYLKISIIAYDDDPETMLSDILHTALPLIGSLLGVPFISSVDEFLLAYEEETGEPLFVNQDDFVGYFEGLWGSDESWGIGQHEAIGTDDLRVWLSIWSDSEPSPMPVLSLRPEPNVSFDGWYVGGSKVYTADKDDTVTARLILSGGDPGQYEMRIGRAIPWAVDETVTNLSFTYDGNSAIKELAFSPPYATGEASTEGYWVQLRKDGEEVWILTNEYPPRLTVNQ